MTSAIAITGTNRQTDVWTLVDDDQLLRASLVDSLTVQGAPLGAYSIELYWDVHGFDDVLIDLKTITAIELRARGN